jgi:hypothetical protein
MIKYEENKNYKTGKTSKIWYTKTEAHGWKKLSAKLAEEKIKSLGIITDTPRYKVWM